jgi:transposase
MSESESLSPRDQAERVALFRAELIGDVSRRALSRGELAAALRTLAAERYLPPGSKTLRYFGVSTFERWLYAYRAHGLAGLRSSPRSDRGRARELTPEQRELLLEIRREHPTASVP